MDSPSDLTDNRQRLDTWMNERRRELRIRTWNQVADRAGMTSENLRKIRRGEISISENAADGIEDALQWERGAVDAAAQNGVEPRPRALKTVKVAAHLVEQAPSETSPADAGTALGEIQRELAYFRYKFRDAPEDFARLMDLIDLYHRVMPPKPSTHGGLEVDA